jgi:hypothetical protein
MLRDRELERMVGEMRIRQNSYFKTRDPYYLVESKKCETIVDRYLLRQKELFKTVDEQKNISDIVQFLKWQQTAINDDPELMKKGFNLIAEMYLFEKT